MIGSATLVALSVLAAPAAAEVTVSPSAAAKNSSTTLRFQVVNDRSETETTKVEIMLPAAHPLPGVTVRPRDGWDYEVQRVDLPTPIDLNGRQITRAVQSVVWRADDSGDRIRPGEHEEFELRVARLPGDMESLKFAAAQTYADGQVDHWREPTPNSTETPTGPAPQLRLVQPPAGGPVGSVAALAIGMVPQQGTSGEGAGTNHEGMGMNHEAMKDPASSGSDSGMHSMSGDGAMEGMDMASMDMSPADQDSVNLALGLAVLALFVGLLAGTFAGISLSRVGKRSTGVTAATATASGPPTAPGTDHG